MNSDIGMATGAKLLSRVRKIGSRLQDLAGRSYQERAFRIPRDWSNREIRRFAPLYTGDVVNVSAWEDRDKSGSVYREYFCNAADYFTTNFGTEQGEMQGGLHEVYLDLEDDLGSDLLSRYDVVFNHTTLEHIWNFRKAFYNLCRMSSDTVILVVPWLQPLHSSYGDYWRFSPQAVARLFAELKMTTLYLSWNHDVRSAVYVFAIATHDRRRWESEFSETIVEPYRPGFQELPKNWAGRFAFGR